MVSLKRALEQINMSIAALDALYSRTGNREYVHRAAKSRGTRDLILKAMRKFPPERYPDLRFSFVKGLRRFDTMLGEWITIASIEYLQHC